jgi:membrane protein
MNIKAIYRVGKDSVLAWVDDYAPSMGAAIAYYTVFSMAPLLVIAIAIAALVFGQEVAQHDVLEQLRGLLGDQGAKAIEAMLEAAQKPKQGALASVLSVITLVIGATGVFNELESDLNRIWKTQGPEGSGLWHLLRTRLLSFGMVIAIGFLLLVSLVVSAGLAAWGRYWGNLFPGMEVLLHAVNSLVSIAVITALFALMYKFLPSVKLRWRQVWVGALVSAVLFTIGKFAIGLYIGKSGVASSYGAAGALVILLLWVYFSAQIFLLGAEVIKVASGSRDGKPDSRDGKARRNAPPF